MISRLKDSSSIPFLRKRYELSNLHYIKWKIIETSSTICEKLTLELLKKAALEKHPELRSAAVKSLKLNGITNG